MIEKLGKVEHARFVEGDLGLHFVYTAGVAGEEFLRALQKGKLLASTCDRCSLTYLPPRIFCEECFAEITDRHEVLPAGTVVSATRLWVDADGAAREPQWVAAIQIDGTDTALLHRVAADAVAIGDRVEAVWAPKRTGSILDVQHFRAEKGARANGKRPLRAAQVDGPARKRRRLGAAPRA